MRKCGITRHTRRRSKQRPQIGHTEALGGRLLHSEGFQARGFVNRRCRWRGHGNRSLERREYNRARALRSGTDPPPLGVLRLQERPIGSQK